jgi:hypothetical protein
VLVAGQEKRTALTEIWQAEAVESFLAMGFGTVEVGSITPLPQPVNNLRLGPGMMMHAAKLGVGRAVCRAIRALAQDERSTPREPQGSRRPPRSSRWVACGG